MLSLQEAKRQISELNEIIEKERKLELEAAVRFAEYRYKNYLPLPPNIIPTLSKTVKEAVSKNDSGFISLINKPEIKEDVLNSVEAMNAKSKLKRELRTNKDNFLQSIDLLLERQIAVLKVKRGQAETKELRQAVALYVISMYSEKATYAVLHENREEITARSIAEKVAEMLLADFSKEEAQNLVSGLVS